MQERLGHIVDRGRSAHLPFLHLRQRDDERDWGQEMLADLATGDPLLQEIEKELINLSCVPRLEEGIKLVRSRFAGAAFQKIAINEMSDYLRGEDLSLLTGDEQLDFFKHLYSQSEVVTMPSGQRQVVATAPQVHEFPFGEKVIENEYYPDGLIRRKDGTILGVLEATLTFDPLYVPNKHRGFHSLQELHPEIFGDSELIFLMPRLKKTRGIARLTGKLANFSIVPMPFTRRQFGKFIDNIYTSRVDEGDVDESEREYPATIEELQQYANQVDLRQNDPVKWDARYLSMAHFVPGTPR